ncbi:hypothetical protein HIM_06091 [Hirsutella minnesotensis 3608]|uniref:AAA+ ATPase domain-containing protein n=1 Tax=Hirsutella minnesotensis 3608 TaxID=1043627 RepID=A0A0F7ZNX2_9HYPO|nr:hypothetical protein HIM_06091 [Hirsutella minnesotensis 3608]
MADRVEQAARRSDDESASVVVVSPAENQSEAGEQPKDDDMEDDESGTGKTLVGALAESKDLYAKYDDQGNRSWTEKKPDDFEEAAENEETEKYAIIVRKIKPKDADLGKALVIDSIVIQSPHLKRVLGRVLDGYPGILTNVARLTLTAPFECIVHRWDRFAAARDNADGELEPEVLAHVELLYRVMREELGSLIQLRADYLRNRAVAFEHAWTLFPPGCIVLGHKNGKPVAARFRRGFYANTACGGKVYHLNCRIVDWDGSIMGWTDLNLRIPAFIDTMPFTDLPCYPLDYHPDAAGIRAQLVERGRRFEALAGFCYRAYRGVALWHPEADETRRENVQSRIVVDGANWERENYDHQVHLTAFHKEAGGGGDGDSDLRWPTRCHLRRSSTYTADSDGDSDDDVADGDEAERAPLTEEQLLLASPMVRGYALQNKRWMEFYVDGVADVQFDEQAFASLVLPAAKKELVLAFAQSQARYKHAFDDVISGKGKGIIMLLSGGPGIGKTLTAESVAEEMRVPLYAMSASDLGDDAYSIDANLTRVLAMVANWNAVLLLDECDVFLEARSPHDLARNRVVAIFLRTLEYYEGILFLTTNRVRDMDPAFQSRIHISLEYPALDAAARSAVWSSFLARTISLADGVRGHAAHDVADDDIAALSALDLNGRVIKNVLKAANLLACHRQERLAMRHIETVLRVEGHSL